MECLHHLQCMTYSAQTMLTNNNWRQKLRQAQTIQYQLVILQYLFDTLIWRIIWFNWQALIRFINELFIHNYLVAYYFWATL